MPTNPYNENLDKNPANYQPLTPLHVPGSARPPSIPIISPIIHGNARITYAEFYARAAGSLRRCAARGIGVGDTVSVMLANTPPMLEAHYGVPMTGAVLHSHQHAARCGRSSPSSSIMPSTKV